jgi:hypothetical protein
MHLSFHSHKRKRERNVAYITGIKISVSLSLRSISRPAGYNSFLEIKRKRCLKSQDTDGATILIGALPHCTTVVPVVSAIRNRSTRLAYLETDRKYLNDGVICQDSTASVVGELRSKERLQMIVTRQSRSTQRDIVPVALRPPQIPMDWPEKELARVTKQPTAT